MNERKLKLFWFTFGCGFPLANYVQRVMAPDEITARTGMYKFYYDRWCGCYSDRDIRIPEEGKVEIAGYFYKPMEKTIVAYSENDIECEEVAV